MVTARDRCKTGGAQEGNMSQLWARQSAGADSDVGADALVS